MRCYVRAPAWSRPGSWDATTNKNNPLGNKMVGPPEMAEEWARKLLRARLLPGKEHAIQIIELHGP
jgi:hypothetical protein